MSHLSPGTDVVVVHLLIESLSPASSCVDLPGCPDSGFYGRVDPPVRGRGVLAGEADPAFPGPDDVIDVVVLKSRRSGA